jgi:hypothetical protein
MLIAKFECTSVKDEGDETVCLEAVTSDTDENKAWSSATPFGELTLQISNPAARGKFTEGKEYLIRIGPADQE